MRSLSSAPVTDSRQLSAVSNHHAMQHNLPSQQHYISFDEFTLELREKLVNPTVAFMFTGLLNAARTNAVLICHALSGSANVGAWWSAIFNTPHPALDPLKYCIICCNSLGSPYGSSSPLTYRVKDDRTSKVRKPYGSDFPKTTLRDDIRIHKKVLDLMGIKSIHCVIGCSMGGMTALEWSLHYGTDYVRSIVLIATAARQTAWGAAWAENQRCTIRCDPKFRDGRYDLDDPPTSGLAAARMAALLTYRTHRSFEERFGKRGMNEATCFSQSYLRYQGDKFNARFDANCYLHILDKIDAHNVTLGRCLSNLTKDEAIHHVLGKILQPTLVIGIPTDGLYPLCEQQTLYENIPNAAFAQLGSEDGHDAFLLEGAQMNGLLTSFLG